MWGGNAARGPGEDECSWWIGCGGGPWVKQAWLAAPANCPRLLDGGTMIQNTKSTLYHDLEYEEYCNSVKQQIVKGQKIMAEYNRNQNQPWENIMYQAIIVSVDDQFYEHIGKK